MCGSTSCNHFHHPSQNEFTVSQTNIKTSFIHSIAHIDYILRKNRLSIYKFDQYHNNIIITCKMGIQASSSRTTWVYIIIIYRLVSTQIYLSPWDQVTFCVTLVYIHTLLHNWRPRPLRLTVYFILFIIIIFFFLTINWAKHEQAWTCIMHVEEAEYAV